MPDGLRPAADLPEDMLERMRFLLSELSEKESAAAAEVEGVAHRLVELDSDLHALAERRRRTAAAQLLAVDSDDLRRVPSDEELLRSSAWSEEHLIVLGRIVETSAGNEVLVRRLLSLALGLCDGPYARDRHADAVFMGSRLKDLARRLSALAALEGVPDWTRDAAAWATTASKAEEKRDALLHRAPAIVMTRSGAAPGLTPARRSQDVEVLTSQAWDVLRAIEQAEREGLLLFGNVTAPHP